MKNIYLSVVLLIIYNILSANPIWFQQPRQHFDTNLFIAGVGEGSCYESAMSIARAELIQQISVSVKSEVLVSFLSIETESWGRYEEIISKNIYSTSEREVQGIEILRQEQSQGRFFVMLGLNMQRMIRNMEIEMSDLWRGIQNSLQNVQRHINNGQIVFAVNTLNDIQTPLIELYTVRAMHVAFAEQVFQISDLITLSDIDIKIRNILSAIRFEINSGDYQSVRRSLLLPHPVVFRAISRETVGDEVLLRNLPVVLSYGDGQIIESGITNERGEYSIRPFGTPNV